MPDNDAAGSKFEHAVSSASGDVLTLTGLFNVILRQRRLIAGCAAFCLVAAMTLSFLNTSYVANASFLPASQSSSMQRLAKLAQTFGVDVSAAGGTGPTLDFYVAVMQSRELLSDLVHTRFKYAASPGGRDSLSTTLLEEYGFVGDTTPRATLKAIQRVRGNLTVSLDPASSLITFEVRAKAAELAEAVGRRLLDLVNEFNIHQLQSGASTERQFVEQRSELARRQLRASEDSLREFLEKNRSFESSPRLVVEQQRLQRVIGLRQELYLSLAQSFEQARISEVRDTPVITIVDPPEGSALRSRHAIRNGVLGLALGLILGTIVGLGREHLRMERESNPADYAEFTRLKQQTVGGLFPGSRRRTG